MKLKFIQSCTIYPEGEEQDVLEDDVLEIADEKYAQLLKEKGHAVDADKAPASRKVKA